MTAVRRIYVGETQVNAFDFTDAKPPGAVSIASAVLTAHSSVASRWDTDSTSAFLVSAVGTISGMQVKYQFRNPTAGKTYRVTCAATFNDGQIVVASIYYEVLNT